MLNRTPPKPMSQLTLGTFVEAEQNSRCCSLLLKSDAFAAASLVFFLFTFNFNTLISFVPRLGLFSSPVIPFLQVLWSPFSA